MKVRQDGIKNGFKQHSPFSTQDEENGKNNENLKGCQIGKNIIPNTFSF